MAILHFKKCFLQICSLLGFHLLLQFGITRNACTLKENGRRGLSVLSNAWGISSPLPPCPLLSIREDLVPRVGSLAGARHGSRPQGAVPRSVLEVLLPFSSPWRGDPEAPRLLLGGPAVWTPRAHPPDGRAHTGGMGSHAQQECEMHVWGMTTDQGLIRV